LSEPFETSSKKPGRGRAKKSLDLIEEMHTIAEAAQPITGRGVGYKIFSASLIPSMARSEMQRPRYRWFVENFGKQCWELDALNPNVLRACVEQEIQHCIEPIAWHRCKMVERAERESLISIMTQWGSTAST
jgi:hypothetical protein